jgi:hypothetical protein
MELVMYLLGAAGEVVSIVVVAAGEEVGAGDGIGVGTCTEHQLCCFPPGTR